MSTIDPITAKTMQAVAAFIRRHPGMDVEMDFIRDDTPVQNDSETTLSRVCLLILCGDQVTEEQAAEASDAIREIDARAPVE